MVRGGVGGDPPVGDAVIWQQPYEFTLTNPFNGSMLFNHQYPDRLYALMPGQCSFVAGEVRSTKTNVPQADGSILHRRFLTGAEMVLAIKMMETPEKPACDWLLQDMTDELFGAFRSLLNAGDNQGRIAWLTPQEGGGFGPTRMLDDIRLLVYPKEVFSTGFQGVVVTVDSKWPNALDLTQQRTAVDDGDTVTLDNTGNATMLPVFQVNRLDGVTQSSSVSAFTITNTTTGYQFEWDDSLPGASAIPADHYAELSCFDNTIYKDGDSTNEDPGIVQLSSDYFGLEPGENDITIDGAPMDVLWQPAWA